LATGPLAIAVVSVLVTGGSAFAGDTLKKEVCTANEHRHHEKRYVSVFIKEDPLKRWKLPAVVSHRTIRVESCTTQSYRQIDTVYWPDGGHTDFADCLFVENLVGDCVDEQGRHWRTKVFAKGIDEIPKEHDYPESALPEIRALFGD
jgi:hypothetical protein